MTVRIADTRTGRVPLPGVLVYAYWRKWQHEGRMGVLVLNSTGASNRSQNSILEYEVFFLPVAVSYSPFGAAFHGGRKLGIVREVFPQLRPVCAQDHWCIKVQIGGRHAGMPWYKGIFGYNIENRGIDGIHHCIDAYIQGPEDDALWTWYLLRDVYEPTEWYLAREIRVHGVREMGPPASMMPAARM